jgi:hypothetical protein
MRNMSMVASGAAARALKPASWVTRCPRPRPCTDALAPANFDIQMSLSGVCFVPAHVDQCRGASCSPSGIAECCGRADMSVHVAARASRLFRETLVLKL